MSPPKLPKPQQQQLKRATYQCSPTYQKFKCHLLAQAGKKKGPQD